MKSPRRPQNPLRTPLNAILGTEAAVRLLRALIMAGTPVAPGELATLAQLGRTTVYPALETLERMGIAEFVGIGARKQVRLREEHSLAPAIVQLFRAEAHRIDALVQELRDVFRAAAPQPISAWMEGVGARDDNEYGIVPLWVVAEPKAIATISEHLASAVAPIERRHSIHLDIHGITRSELEEQAHTRKPHFASAALLAGAPPSALLPPPRRPSRRSVVRTHDEHDARARRLAVAMAAKLKWDPSLLRVARDHIRERAGRASAAERKELAEWLRILDAMSAAQVQRFLLDDSEKAVRLRQTLPALNLLTPAEREAVMASSTDDEARAAVLGGT